jgi:hypothetical protein
MEGRGFILMNRNFWKCGKEEPLARGMHNVVKGVEATGCVTKANGFRRIRKDVPNGSSAGVTKVSTNAWKGKALTVA